MNVLALLGTLPRSVVIVGAVAALIVPAMALGRCSGERAERARAAVERAEANTAAQTRAREADLQARAQLEAQRAALQAQEQEMADALRGLDPGTLGDRQRARACVILMRQARAGGPAAPAHCRPPT